MSLADVSYGDLSKRGFLTEWFSLILSTFIPKAQIRIALCAQWKYDYNIYTIVLSVPIHFHLRKTKQSLGYEPKWVWLIVEGLELLKSIRIMFDDCVYNLV